jgi:Cu/Ag efflux protein CusF
MKRSIILPILLAGTLAMAQPAGADSGSHHAVGVVKSIDANKGTVTLAHGAVASLNWPAMTMTFKMQDKKLLEKLSAGQKIEVDFVQQGKDHVITKVK